jgi:hypothetical protein
MPLFDFELLYQAGLTEQQTYDEYELPPVIDPYDPYAPNIYWEIAFEDEIPEFIYMLEDYDEIESFSIISETPTIEEEYPLDYEENYDLSFYYFPFDNEIRIISRLWELEMEDHFYDLSTMLWKVESVEEFLITFPYYWLHSQTFFDFGDVTYNPNYIKEEFPVNSPLLYFIQVFEEPFGDILFNNLPISQDTFLSYLYLVFNMVFSSEILPNVPTTYTLLELDYFPNFIDSVQAWVSVWAEVEVTIRWGIIFADSIVPDPNIKVFEWKLKDTEIFIVFALRDEETFDVVFSLIYFDDMGDIATWVLIDTYVVPYLFKPYRFNPSLLMPYKYDPGFPSILEETELSFMKSYDKFDERWRPERLHMYSMKAWQDTSFDSYFDFQDFNCRTYTVDTECSVRNEDSFDLTAEFNLPFVEQTYDEYEALIEFIIIDFRRILTEEFYDFSIFYKGTYDTFDFKADFTLLNEIKDLDGFVFPIDIRWKDAPEPDENFNLDFKDYVLYTNDQISFYIDKGTTYQLFLEDEFDNTLICIESGGLLGDAVFAEQ